jgi:uncharacterized OB-fold protein
MAETQSEFTIENFYNHIKEKKLMASKCSKCGKVTLPPKPMCPECLSRSLQWTELPKEGKLLTYTVIHVAPEKFQHLTPYPVGIIEFEPGVKLPGIIKDVPLDKIKVGLKLKIDFDTKEIQQEWPQWPRYYFRPIE